MKIAYISSDYGIPVFGNKGASVHIREIASALINLNNEVTIYSPRADNDSENSYQFNAVEIKISDDYEHIFRLIRLTENHLGTKAKTYNDLNKYLYNLTLYNSLLPIFKKERFDLVYERYSVFGYCGISIARKFKIPHFLEVNAPLCDEHDKMIGFSLRDLAYRMEKIIFNKTDHIFVVSEYLKEYASKYGAPLGKIKVLPNGVDTTKFKNGIKKRSYIRSKYNIDNKIVIGFVGNIRPWHGIDNLFNSFTEVRELHNNIHLFIVGNSHKENELENLIKKSRYAEYITCTGFVPHEDIPSYISAMDITVAPYNYTAEFYFSPMKILEYMACKKPVIAANLGQISKIIDDGVNGLLYKAGDTQALLMSLSQLIQNKNIRIKLGNSGYEWVNKNRSWETNAKIILKCIDLIA